MLGCTVSCVTSGASIVATSCRAVGWAACRALRARAGRALWTWDAANRFESCEARSGEAVLITSQEAGLAACCTLKRHAGGVLRAECRLQGHVSVASVT